MDVRVSYVQTNLTDKPQVLRLPIVQTGFSVL